MEIVFVRHFSTPKRNYYYWIYLLDAYTRLLWWSRHFFLILSRNYITKILFLYLPIKKAHKFTKINFHYRSYVCVFNVILNSGRREIVELFKYILCTFNIYIFNRFSFTIHMKTAFFCLSNNYNLSWILGKMPRSWSSKM